jgi:cytochrome b pre-mRNA-processing protein 3
MGNLFYGLVKAVDEALDRGDLPGLGVVLARNVYGDAGPDHAAALAAYLVDESARLALVPASDIVAGSIPEAA